MKRQIPQRKATENEAKSGRKRTRSKRNEIDCADDDFKPSNSVKKSPVAVKQKNKAMGLNWTIEEKTNQAPVSDGMCHEEKGSLDYCPICQFPFKYLVGQNEDWHVSDCLTSRGTTPSQGATTTTYNENYEPKNKNPDFHTNVKSFQEIFLRISLGSLCSAEPVEGIPKGKTSQYLIVFLTVFCKLFISETKLFVIPW